MNNVMKVLCGVLCALMLVGIASADCLENWTVNAGGAACTNDVINITGDDTWSGNVLTSTSSYGGNVTMAFNIRMRDKTTTNAEIGLFGSNPVVVNGVDGVYFNKDSGGDIYAIHQPSGFSSSCGSIDNDTHYINISIQTGNTSVYIDGTFCQSIDTGGTSGYAGIIVESGNLELWGFEFTDLDATTTTTTSTTTTTTSTTSTTLAPISGSCFSDKTTYYADENIILNYTVTQTQYNLTWVFLVLPSTSQPASEAGADGNHLYTVIGNIGVFGNMSASCEIEDLMGNLATTPIANITFLSTTTTTTTTTTSTIISSTIILYAQPDYSNYGISRFGGTGFGDIVPQMRDSAPFFLNVSDYSRLYCIDTLNFAIDKTNSPTTDINVSLWESSINTNGTIIPNIYLNETILSPSFADNTFKNVSLIYCGLNASYNYSLVYDIVGAQDDTNFYQLIINVSANNSPYHNVNYINDYWGWADHFEDNVYQTNIRPVIQIFGSFAATTTTTTLPVTTTTLGGFKPTDIAGKVVDGMVLFIGGFVQFAPDFASMVVLIIFLSLLMVSAIAMTEGGRKTLKGLFGVK